MSNGSVNTLPRRKSLDDLEDKLKELQVKWESNGKPPVKISECETVLDVKLMIAASISVLRANSGKTLYRPYYDRLKKLEAALT